MGACTRGLLKRVEIQLAEAGLTALVGHELEFVLVTPNGSSLGPEWVADADRSDAGVSLLSSDLTTTLNPLDFSERTRRPSR